MVILGSNEGGGSDIDGITEGVCGVTEGAEGATSGIGSVEGTVGTDALLSAGISTGCGSSGYSGPVGLPGLHYRMSYSSIYRE